MVLLLWGYPYNSKPLRPGACVEPWTCQRSHARRWMRRWQLSTQLVQDEVIFRYENYILSYCNRRFWDVFLHCFWETYLGMNMTFCNLRMQSQIQILLLKVCLFKGTQFNIFGISRMILYIDVESYLYVLFSRSRLVQSCVVFKVVLDKANPLISNPLV